MRWITELIKTEFLVCILVDIWVLMCGGLYLHVCLYNGVVYCKGTVWVNQWVSYSTVEPFLHSLPDLLISPNAVLTQKGSPYNTLYLCLPLVSLHVRHSACYLPLHVVLFPLAGTANMKPDWSHVREISLNQWHFNVEAFPQGTGTSLHHCWTYLHVYEL